jgi:LPPG:FO 2-phospho-L-lactate transferase
VDAVTSDPICVISGEASERHACSAGSCAVVDPSAITAIVNVGDDLELHGLRISPDLDTITYTLAGEIDPEKGWGLRDESWQAMATVARYGGIDWFNLGDRDLGTHLYRTQRTERGGDPHRGHRRDHPGVGARVCACSPSPTTACGPW